MARFPNLSPDATPIRMERTTIFALISLVVLEVTIVFPTVWLLGEDSTSWQPILRILLCPLRLLQSWYLVRQFCGTEPSDESAKRCCCWKLLPYCLVVMESGFLLVQIDYMEGSAIRILLMIAHTILWTVDVAGMIYLISPCLGRAEIQLEKTLPSFASVQNQWSWAERRLVVAAQSAWKISLKAMRLSACPAATFFTTHASRSGFCEVDIVLFDALSR